VLHYFICIVDAHDLIRLVYALARSGTPTVQNRHFLSHVLAGLGPAKRQLLFLHTLTW
jgi:hypothetical protein